MHVFLKELWALPPRSFVPNQTSCWFEKKGRPATCHPHVVLFSDTEGSLLQLRCTVCCQHGDPPLRGLLACNSGGFTRHPAYSRQLFMSEGLKKEGRPATCHPHGGISFVGALSATHKAAARNEKTTRHRNFLGVFECFHRMPSFDTLIKITRIHLIFEDIS